MAIRGICAKAGGARAAATSAGLGLSLAWLFSMFCFEGPIGPTDSGYGVRHDSLLLAATFTIAALAFTTYRSASARALLARVLQSWTSVAAALAVSFACVFALCLPSDPPAAAAVGVGVVAGTAFFLMANGWFALLYDYDAKDVGPLFVIALAVVFLAVFVAVALPNTPFRIALMCAYLPVSGFLLYAASPAETLAASGASNGNAPESGLGARSDVNACAASSDVQNLSDEGGEVPAIVRKVAAFSFVSCFVGMFVWVLDIKLYEAPFTELLFQTGLVYYTYALSGMIIVVLFFAIQLASKRSGFVVMVIHRITLIALVLSVALALVGDEFLLVAYTASHLAFFLTQASMWVIVLRASYLLGDAPVRHVGLVMAWQYAGYFCAFLFLLAVFPLLISSRAVALGILLVCLAAICVVFQFVFTETDIRSVEKVSVASPDEVFARTCADIRKRYGLTEREGEVFELLARGKNAVTIQDELFISYGTVKSHRHSIYSKLNLHSHQELLLFVEHYGEKRAG